jgi:hypothetical protein
MVRDRERSGVRAFEVMLAVASAMLGLAALGAACLGPAGSGLTLLLIDDEPQVRRFLRSSLASTDYTLLEAATGQAGSWRLHRGGPTSSFSISGCPISTAST